MADHGPEVDSSQVYSDDVLERELRDAMKSEGEIELFKLVAVGLRVRGEVATTETVAIMLSKMWSNVADFFESVTEATTLAGLAPDSDLVIQHQRMLANFHVVAEINKLFRQSSEAETELMAIDHMSDQTDEEIL